MAGLTERQMMVAADMGFKDKLSEMEKCVKRYNGIITMVLNTPVDIDSIIEYNKTIKCPSEYRPVFLKERIDEAVKMERAKNHKFVKAFMLAAIEFDPEDPLEIQSIYEIDFDEFVDSYIAICR